MELNRNSIVVMVLMLAAGMTIGALFLGGSSADPAIDHSDHDHVLDESGQWTCSMHPQVRQSESGSCPFCGMALIPVNDEANGDPAILKMSNAAVQLANIQTTEVKAMPMTGSLLLNGKVQADERRINTQTTHFGGRIEKLYKDYIGQTVRKGERIASLYSPELLAAQEELIEAKKLEDSNPVLLEAARKKMRYWKLSPAQVRAIEESEAPMRNFDLLADFDGVVTGKMVNAGDHLHEGGALLEITDLSKVWVVFEVYEQDLDQVTLGDAISFSTPDSRAPFEARISFIAPEVDPATRIVKVRADLNNPSGLLKPDMFVKATLQGQGAEALLVPRSAVLWTGKRSIVYLQGADPLEFELREITLGGANDDYYEVLNGLRVGDLVVTNGAFTLDAEAQLRGKLSMMTPAVTVSNPETVEFTEVSLPPAKDLKGQVDAAFKNQLQALSMEYLKLKDQMVEGNGTAIRKAAVGVKAALNGAGGSLSQGAANDHWQVMQQPMAESLAVITTTGDRDVQRLQFINLSKALINAVQSFGTSFESPLYIQYCPMANNDQGATWISSKEEIVNPYFGDLMLHCGNIEEIIEND